MHSPYLLPKSLLHLSEGDSPALRHRYYAVRTTYTYSADGSFRITHLLRVPNTPQLAIWLRATHFYSSFFSVMKEDGDLTKKITGEKINKQVGKNEGNWNLFSLEKKKNVLCGCGGQVLGIHRIVVLIWNREEGKREKT